MIFNLCSTFLLLLLLKFLINLIFIRRFFFVFIWLSKKYCKLIFNSYLFYLIWISIIKKLYWRTVSNFFFSTTRSTTILVHFHLERHLKRLLHWMLLLKKCHSSTLKCPSFDELWKEVFATYWTLSLDRCKHTFHPFYTHALVSLMALMHGKFIFIQSNFFFQPHPYSLYFFCSNSTHTHLKKIINIHLYVHARN